MEKKFKVLLIDPKGISPGINIGLGYLASSLFKNGYTVRVLDLNNRKVEIYEEITKTVQNFSPDIIGVSIHSLTYFISCEIIKFLKRNYNLLTIAGGPQTIVEEEKIFEDFDSLDFSLLGECEKSLPNLLDNIKEKNFENVPGVFFRENDRIKKTFPFELIEDLDSLPFPDYNLFGVKRIRCYPLLTSRGCPYNCIFCPPHFGKKWRARLPEKIIEEIKYAINKYNISSYSIVDPVFNLDILRCELFCELLIKEKITLPWSVEGMRADKITEKLAKKMKKANCYSVSIGIETLIPEIYKNIQKGATLQEVKEGIKILKKNKIRVAGNFIIGLPGDTYENSLKNFKEVKKLKLDTAVFQLLVPYPGTKIYEWAKREGIIHRDYKNVDSSIFPQGKAVASFSTSEFSKEEREKIFEVITIKSGIYPPKLEDINYLKYLIFLLSKIIKFDFWHLPLHLFRILIKGINLLIKKRTKELFYSSNLIFDRKNNKWENYWRKNLKFKILEFIRKTIISREVYFYANSYLPKEGIILECGSGAGESSIYLKNNRRVLIATDISLSALQLAREKNIYKYLVLSDIRKLPFKNESISGIYNIGVMEHFPEEDLKKILKGFKDVLNKNGKAVLFWPYALGPFVLFHTIFTTIILLPFYFFHKKLYSILDRKVHSVFPEGHWLFFRPSRTKRLLNLCGFTKIKFKLSLFFFSHCIVYLEK